MDNPIVYMPSPLYLMEEDIYCSKINVLIFVNNQEIRVHADWCCVHFHSQGLRDLKMISGVC